MSFSRIRLPWGAHFSSDAYVCVPNDNPDLMRVSLEADEWPPPILKNAHIIAATTAIKNALEHMSATGVRYRKCSMSKSSQFLEMFPTVTDELPNYWHLVIYGIPLVDDLGIEGNNQLVVSDRVAAYLRLLNIEDLEVSPA